MTEFEIVTSVMELVTSAEGVTNTSLSPDQVADELDTLRVRMIMEADKLTIFRRPYQGYTQQIPSLKVEKDSNKVSFVKIPRLVIKANGEPSVLYIGGKDDKSPYRVVTGDVQNALHDHFVGKMAIALYHEGTLTFKNVAPQFIKVVAVFEDPSDLDVGGNYDPENDEYPFPAGMIDVLIGKTAESYIRTMYRIRPQPNVQTDIPNAGPQSK
jgi:hypothetical protein